MGDWIYPFQGRRASGPTTQNFLWRESPNSNVYVMDNHLAALWCWLQHMDLTKKHQVVHIDAHFDAAQITSESRLALLDGLESKSFAEYLALGRDPPDALALIRWDNYLSILLQKFRDNVLELNMATHGLGDKPSGPPCVFLHQHEILPAMLPELLRSPGGERAIVNIDLDYFFYRNSDGSYIRLHSSGYLADIARTVKIGLSKGQVCCLTICLSPECCGRWAQAEEICTEFCQMIGVSFALPPSD